MTKPFKKIHNITNNEIIEREMTDEEFSQYELDQLNAQKEAMAEKSKVKKRQELLEKLGITEEEAKLLLG